MIKEPVRTVGTRYYARNENLIVWFKSKKKRGEFLRHEHDFSIASGAWNGLSYVDQKLWRVPGKIYEIEPTS